MFDLRRMGTEPKRRLTCDHPWELPGDACLLHTVRPDRRRSPRNEIELTITATSADGKVFKGFSRDLSREGTAALIWGKFNLGDELELAYRIPETEQAVTIPAIVRYAIGFRYGLEFQGEHQAEMSRFLVGAYRSPIAV